MKEFIMQYSDMMTQELSIRQISMNMIVALVLGLVIYLSYRFSHSGAVYSQRFNVSLLMMTLITTMIMNVIGNNIALSLGMVGALSIVRFRTAIKDSRDTAYIFWCIAVGICCGVSYYALCCIGTGMIFLVMLVMGSVKANDRYLLIIHAKGDVDVRKIEETVLVQYKGKATLRVANRSKEQIEYIYELSTKLINDSKKNEKNPIDMLSEIESVYRVNLVCQNEEMSR
ncbi:MAG: DUF4956 domain-containing protein [Tyzzerella sp.]|uniref:DUF4956 domain-containing protein n=1 Tax=Candidatus Fimicola merdigallinarum TaxID=2840819 RepID=A0A9D9DV87_9FIRM|nr:DUF4956 domain-containing protein [Candidatus Fimicola merdigallinarum]